MEQISLKLKNKRQYTISKNENTMLLKHMNSYNNLAKNWIVNIKYNSISVIIDIVSYMSSDNYDYESNFVSF